MDDHATVGHKLVGGGVIADSPSPNGEPYNYPLLGGPFDGLWFCSPVAKPAGFNILFPWHGCPGGAYEYTIEQDGNAR